MITVSVVIRALDESQHLPGLFAGLQEQTRQPDQVILVDSGSTDRSVEIATAAGAEIVHIAPEDFSFGRALNVGCHHATGDILVFASAHVYPVDELWLQKLIAPFESHAEVALVYGRQTGEEGWSAFSEMEIMRRWFPDLSDDAQDHPFCNNANCAVRASVWRDIPYDEDLTGLEDLAWAKAALDDGHRLWYEAGACVVHLHNESLGQTVNRYRREAIAHKAIFGQQSMSTIEGAVLVFANVARDYLAAIPRRKLLKNVTAIPAFRAAQFWGTWQGFRQQGDPTTTLKRRFYYPKGMTPRSKRRPAPLKKAL
jgi:glycosyltransferase involved in cell wall biosynthesis